MKDGSVITEEKGLADAHPAGLRPFGRAQYIEKFKTLTDGLIGVKESKRFLNCVQNLKNLKAKDLAGLNVEIKNTLKKSKSRSDAIF